MYETIDILRDHDLSDEALDRCENMSGGKYNSPCMLTGCSPTPN
jgi:hypothetical protein